MIDNKSSEPEDNSKSNAESTNYGNSTDSKAMPSAQKYHSPPNSNPMSSPSSGTATYIDPEDLQAKNFDFSEQSIRKGFIRKVYAILMSQLLVTFGCVAAFVLHAPLQKFTVEHRWFVYLVFIIGFIILISMSCCDVARRLYPLNLICLGTFTLAWSILIGAIAARFKVESILFAVGITAILCLTLTIFAMQTKYDFTTCGGILSVCLMCLLIFGIVGIFWRDHIVHTVYAGCGALLMSIYLIYDTQIMIGGTHKYSISPEEYVFAALNLYLDVVNIFLYILQLLGGRE